jgi:hypothetical protein
MGELNQRSAAGARRRHRHFSRAVALLCFALWAMPALAAAQMRAQFDVRVPMRDGVELSTDVWLPDGDGTYPAILLRTPYLKAPQFVRYRLEYFVKHGYAVLLQDVRGRGDSDGDFHFLFGEAEDGYDTIEWIADQSWSNGKVGTSGGSYLATVQWLTARERPPHLECILPTASSGRLFDEVPYLGGAFRAPWALEWLNDASGRSSQGSSAVSLDWEAIAAHRPLLTMDEFMGRRMPLWREFLEHPTLDDYWRPIYFQAKDFGRIDIPVLTVTGWFDGDQLGALSYWDGMAAHNAENQEHYLIIGPWTHAQTYLGGALAVGDMELAPQSVIGIQEVRRKFFDYCLKGATPSFDEPRARVYVTGADEWRELNVYPPPRSQPTPLYLHSGGRANTSDGDGTLSWDAPDDERPDHYTYDPRRPQGGRGHAEDRRPLQRRDDVLVYTTDALADAVEIIGRVFVNLHASSDALDTDFMARLSDVYPDGRVVGLGPTTGVRRARYRNGYQRTELLTPNKPELFQIELFDIGHRFLPGHRIRIEITSSDPVVNPNQNTGNPIATDTEWKTANQTVYHDRLRLSHVLLPVIR